MQVNTLVKIKKKYHHGDLREQLLEAVRELVELHGPDGFSIAQACRKAGVSTAAPYKHFRDRQEILRGMVLLAMERMRTAMLAAADAHPAKSPERIAALGQAYVDFARREPGVFRAMFGLTEGHDQDPELNCAGDDTFAVVLRVVAEHLDLGMDDPRTQGRAYALWCFVHGHSFLMLDKKVLPEGAISDETALMQLVGSAILPPPKA